ncbi:MAG: GTPase Era [Anaerolineae bacterium]|nr:GTPase Era [Anaerolineae bacterium]
MEHEDAGTLDIEEKQSTIEPAAEEVPWYEEPLPPDHRSGFVAVVGRPNVGKSSLMNAYLGQKIAIVTPKPQTTRNRLLGILTLPNAQIVFVDTPGIHQPRHKLGQYLVAAATSAVPEADVIVFMVDLSVMPTDEDRMVANLLARKSQAPVLLAMNKVDLLRPADIQHHAEAYLALGQFDDWILTSVTRGDNLDKLREMIIARLPFGPRYYPPDQITDQEERFMAAELIREQVLLHTYEEVPHGVAVVVEEFKERRPDLTYISAVIYVERESQKGIIIGAKGEMLKRIGTAARREIEHFLGHQVYLELWVKVRKKWRQDERQLRYFGYKMP